MLALFIRKGELYNASVFKLDIIPVFLISCSADNMYIISNSVCISRQVKTCYDRFIIHVHFLCFREISEKGYALSMKVYLE